MPQDNTTLARKVLLRQLALKAVRACGLTPVVMETHAGYGMIWQRCYQTVTQGIAFEKDASRVRLLAQQRPTWAVYGGDCLPAIAAGAGAHLLVNILDLDPYGQPWPVLEAFFASTRPRAPYLALVVNDGLRQKLQRGGGWQVDTMQTIVHRWNNHDLSANYLTVCQEMVQTLAAPAGKPPSPRARKKNRPPAQKNQ